MFCSSLSNIHNEKEKSGGDLSENFFLKHVRIFVSHQHHMALAIFCSVSDPEQLKYGHHYDHTIIIHMDTQNQCPVLLMHVFKHSHFPYVILCLVNHNAFWRFLQIFRPWLLPLYHPCIFSLCFVLHLGFHSSVMMSRKRSQLESPFLSIMACRKIPWTGDMQFRDKLCPLWTLLKKIPLKRTLLKKTLLMLQYFHKMVKKNCVRASCRCLSVKRVFCLYAQTEVSKIC